MFQSTLPTRGSDKKFASIFTVFRRFNPRSPRGGATLDKLMLDYNVKFQSTLPTRGSD